MSLWTSWVSTLICKSREYINLSPRIDIIHFLTHFCSFCFDRLADGSKQSQLFWQKLLDKMAQPTKKIDKNIFFYQPPENSVSPARACASLKMWRLFLAGWQRTNISIDNSLETWIAITTTEFGSWSGFLDKYIFVDTNSNYLFVLWPRLF